MDSKKSLYIIRHGKSSWDLHDVSDIDRPLMEKGIFNAYQIAGTLKKKNLTPDLIYTSPAVRALHTAIIFSRVIEIPEANILIKNDIYLSDVNQLLKIINEAPPEAGSLMIFGHNPGFTNLVNHLSDLRLSNLPTSGMVFLQFSVKKWVEIERSNLISYFHEFPGDH